MGSAPTFPNTVLLVDDDEPTREAVAELLQNLGYRTVEASNGAQGLELLRARQPSLVLLDLMMPVMNGWQFLEERRKDGELSKIPVVVVSAALDATAELPNVAGYLRKPVAAEPLIALLERLRAGSPVVHPAPSAPRHPKSHLRVLLVQESDAAAHETLALLKSGDEFQFDVRRAHGLAEALTHDALGSADVILLDTTLSGETGLAALKKTVRRALAVPVVALLGPGTLTRRDALRYGAYDAVRKDAQTPELIGRSLEHAAERFRLGIELERARELAAHERERRGLQQLSQPRSVVAAEMLGQQPLRQASADTFRQLVSEFVAICDRAIAEREHELESPLQRKELQRLSDAFAALRAGPGDIVDVYQEALSSAWSTETSELASAKREEARLMLIGVLGYVLASYRLYAAPERH